MRQAPVILSVALIAALSLAASADAGIFKCERTDGRIEYRATPCPVESSETEFTKSGIRTEHTRAPVETVAVSSVPEEEELPAEHSAGPRLSEETGSAMAELCRGQFAKLEKMKVLGKIDDDSPAMSAAEFDEFVKGFEAQVEESCAQYL